MWNMCILFVIKSQWNSTVVEKQTTGDVTRQTPSVFTGLASMCCQWISDVSEEVVVGYLALSYLLSITVFLYRSCGCSRIH